MYFCSNGNVFDIAKTLLQKSGTRAMIRILRLTTYVYVICTGEVVLVIIFPPLGHVSNRAYVHVGWFM